MKVSEITNTHIADYIRLTEYEDEKDFLTNLINIALAFIKSYTGLSDDELDQHEDFVIVVYILCQHMYDTRVLYVDKSNLNKVVETILGMHRKNLL